MKPSAPLFAVITALALASCGSRVDVMVQLADHSGLAEKAPVVLDGAVVGKVTHLRFAKESKKAVAVVNLDKATLAKLDPQTLFAVRPVAYGQDAQRLVISNVCVSGPKGLAPNATVKGYGGLISHILPRVARDHDACMKRLGEGAFKALRDAFAVPGGD